MTDLIQNYIPGLVDWVFAAFIWLDAFIAGYLLTEHRDALWLKLPRLLDMRPFNCRLCMTCHLTWMGFGALGFWRPCYWILGVAATAWTWYILSHRDDE